MSGTGTGLTRRILVALETAPSTTRELAAILPEPRRDIAARISDLRRLGVVEARRRIPTRTRPASLWEVRT